MTIGADMPPEALSPLARPPAVLRTAADVDAEQRAVLYAIGVKTYQRHTLALEISGLESRVRALNQEAAAIVASAKEPTDG